MNTYYTKTNDNVSKENSKHLFFAGKNQASLTPSPFFQSSLIQKKLDAAINSSAESLDNETKPALENFLSADLGNVKVHNNPASHEASDLINAKAYTTGNHIFLGHEANKMSHLQRKSLLAHEVAHTIQQRHFSQQLQAKMAISQPGDALENEADSIAREFIQAKWTGSCKSPAHAMRSQQRLTSATAPVIQREEEITGNKDMAYGNMELAFKKVDATVLGNSACEEGCIKFTPNNNAPESNEIRLLQIVRVTDVGGKTAKANEPVDWSKVDSGNEANRNKVLTDSDNKKNIAGGFYIDHLSSMVNQRTNKSDASVSPYYNAYQTGTTEQINISSSDEEIPDSNIVANSATGKKKGNTKEFASLKDSPGCNFSAKYNFVTSAKANDTGAWYGTVLWGFEIYLDNGIAKIKDQYHSFREIRGETTDAALKKFNEFYKNPGTSGAPAK